MDSKGELNFGYYFVVWIYEDGVKKEHRKATGELLNFKTYEDAEYFANDYLGFSQVFSWDADIVNFEIEHKSF